MKRIFYFFLALLFFFSCTSSRKYLERAQYDAAINKSISKLRKNPSNENEIDVLKQAYSKANMINRDRIEQLRTSGEPDVWDDIFTQYNSLKNRQDGVKTLPDNVLAAINFREINYNSEIAEAKAKAAEYFYKNAIVLMEKRDRQSAREAYYNFQKIKGFYSNYKDVDSRMQEALFLGTNNILFVMKNQTNMMLPKDFESELLKISVKELNSQWLNYDTYKDPERFYDYSIELSLKGIAVSPEQVKENSFTEEREIEDGFKYMLDKKGNVMKDTAGNDIKIPKIKVITCNVLETYQLKKAMITGTLDYRDNRSKQLIRTFPVNAEMIFEHRAYMAVGDLNALKPETRRKIGTKPLPFPPDPQMVMDAGNVLKNITKDIIWNNRGIIME